MLSANTRRYPLKSVVLVSLFLLAASGLILFLGISINMNNNNKAQAQEQQQQQQEVGQTKINELWETPADLKNPESVVYAPKQDVLFVSNIEGKPDQKDQNGFISKVSPLNGSIVELNWITGLNAPKGMAVYDNGMTLFQMIKGISMYRIQLQILSISKT
jgi:hypothetical protein